MSPSKNNYGIQTILAALLRVACGFIFLYASLDKLGSAEKFMGTVQEYHILPKSLIALAAVVIPWIEFFTGLLLITGIKWRGAALLFCALMIAYSLALSWNLLHGVEMNCGCFSMDATEKTTWLTVARDFGFLAMGVFVLLSPKTVLSLERSTDPKS